MPDFDVQIVMQANTNVPKDVFVNTLHFSAAGPLDWDESADGLGPQIATAWATVGALIGNVVNRPFQVRLYNPDDPKPRQPRTYTGTLANAATGEVYPWEVALCLSFYGERNLPRQRGRIYLGPIALAYGNNGRPTSGAQTILLDLATALSNAGGANVDWQQVSTVTGQRQRVQHAWVDNAWDTQRRRGLGPTSRATRAVSG